MESLITNIALVISLGESRVCQRISTTSRLLARRTQWVLASGHQRDPGFATGFISHLPFGTGSVVDTELCSS
ncbi:hypothetical protein [Nocardia suismassiliense]|uniref:hypothetical protein n=1 Tax=Nocardia suismassiliense TaxID=2077092 RepID=UPI00131F44AF|nr:hypothetical protein [Nocardia suismassiliense]